MPREPDRDAPAPPVARKELIRGAALWTLFCVVAVALRGVRWDEQYEMAQVVLRLVPYPDDHPLFRCTRSALNLQIYFTSALLWLTNSPVLVCGFRNVLHLMANTLPVFLIGSTLARNCRLGHVAVVLVLMGLPEEFHGSYPLHVWPGYSSTGPVGTGFALLIAFFLVSGAWRSGLFVLGLMPGIHIAQMPASLALALLRCADALRTPERRRMFRGMIWLTAGLVLCALMWLGRGLVSVPPPVQGPYFSAEAAAPIWRTFVNYWDEHRALPGGMIQYTRAFFAMGAALLLTGACARIERRRFGAIGVWQWLWAYIAFCSAAVWGVMIIHEVLGERVPYVLIAWMPYRFSNHVVLVLLAALPAMLMFRTRKDGIAASAANIILLGALAFGVLRPVLASWLPGAVYGRYVATGEGVFFLLCGLASAALFRAMGDDRVFRDVGMALQIAGLAALAAFHHFGAAMAALGMVVGLGLPLALSGKSRIAAWFAPSPLVTRGLGIGCVLALAVLLFPQWQARQHLARTDINERIVRLLAERGEPGAMLVSNPDQYSLQAQTGHPVLVDGPLALWIPYMPSLGPAIQKIESDIYGIRYAALGGSVRPSWLEVWTARSTADWQALAREYSIRYVVCPGSTRLNLPEVLREADRALYEIPREEKEKGR
ncbi:MAG: hypothetical protein HZB26_11955 [Candidatus Hydrogenedentes bacterium]|nr:hypothetical protein [Candidatus Hydrogenedentota bacterium]